LCIGLGVEHSKTRGRVAPDPPIYEVSGSLSSENCSLPQLWIRGTPGPSLLLRGIGAVPAARPAALSALLEVDAGEHQEPGSRVQVAGLAAPLGGIVGPLCLG
jgi:hypothetical protein